MSCNGRKVLMYQLNSCTCDMVVMCETPLRLYVHPGGPSLTIKSLAHDASWGHIMAICNGGNIHDGLVHTFKPLLLSHLEIF